MLSWELQIAALFGVGLVAAVINTVAGGGSFLTIPAFVWLGQLSETEANGTNRIGILLGNLSASVGFFRRGLVDKSDLAWSALPATFGGLIGAYAATQVSNELFRNVLAFLMVTVSLYTLWSNERKPKERPTLSRQGAALAFVGVGLYAGFVQAGTGFFALAVTTAAGLDLVRGNAVKVTMNLILTIAALLVFARHGTLVLGLGLANGLGMLVGGYLGMRLSVWKGNRWLGRFVTFTIILFAVLLLVTRS